MEKFNKTLRGYDPNEVNAFLDSVIRQVEGMIEEAKQKDEKLAQAQESLSKIETLEEENKILAEKVTYYARMENTLNQAILMAQKTSNQMKSSAIRESEVIIGDAKNNASRIVNEALLKAERIEKDAESLKRNVKIFKRRLKEIVESQIEIIDDIEKIEL